MFIVEFYQDMSPLREIATSNAEFCMLLFYNITSKKDLIATDAEIKDHTPQAKYSSYIRDKQCRPINSLAHKICRYRSPEEFEKFLNDNAHYPHIKQELLSNFKNRYKDRKITEKNLFKQIAAIFDKLIEDAEKEYENNREKRYKNKSKQSDIPITNSEPNEVSIVEETTAISIENNNENTQIVDSCTLKRVSSTNDDIFVDQETEEHIETKTTISVERKAIVANATNSESFNTICTGSASEGDNSVQINSVFVKQVEPLTSIFEGNIATKPETEINSYIENASTSKSSNPSKTTGSNDNVKSYTITEPKKQAIINICGIILETLDTIRLNTKSFESVRIDIEKFAKSEENQCLIEIREYKQASLEKTLQTDYEKLENVCADMVKIITPQIYILNSSEKLCSIGRYISEGIPLNIDGFISKNNDEYKITSSAYKTHVLPMLIRQFKSIYKTIQASIKKL